MPLVDGPGTIINAILLTEQGSTPATPETTKWKLFTKADGLYLVDAAGVVTGPMAAAVAVSAPDYIRIEDQKSSGVAGGTFTTGAWQTRTLNTEVQDTGNHASIASNQITLDAGTYDCRISAPALYVNAHQAKLYNITDSSDTLMGQISQSCLTGNGDVTNSVIAGRFTIAGSKTFEVQHRCTNTENTDGFGIGVSWGTGVFTVCEFWKVA